MSGELDHPGWCAAYTACEAGNGGPHRSRAEAPVDEAGRRVVAHRVSVAVSLWQGAGPPLLRLDLLQAGRTVTFDLPAADYGLALGRLVVELCDQAAEEDARNSDPEESLSPGVSQPSAPESA